MFNNHKILLIAISVLLVACDSDLPSKGGDDFKPVGYAEPLEQSGFESLSPTQQYQVASKLLGTMYKGIPVEDFLNPSSNLGSPQLKTPNASANYIQSVRNALNTDLNNSSVDAIQQIVLDSSNSSKYTYTSSNDSPSAKEEPLAFIHETPLSRNSFIRWMAHFLANTIMFSPAEEMESTFNTDVRRTYKLLIDGLTAGNTVRQIIRAQLPSLQRWRVARTPENAGIEGFELYLGLFDSIEDSRRVGIACQDFYLLDADNGYLLETSNLVNTDPQIILQEDRNGDGTPETGGYFITSCNDFYDVLAGHPLIIPRACEVIINYLMAERSLDDRLQMCQSIAASGATTFEDIFKGILFSEQYLLHTERPKGFEETLMPALHALKWHSRQNNTAVSRPIWQNMASSTTSRLSLANMGWGTMTLKIGRTPNVPLDPLGFANYHKAMREELLLNLDSYDGANFNGTAIAGLLYTGASGGDTDANLHPHIAALNTENFIHFLFLTALQRPADSTELSSLINLLQTQTPTPFINAQRQIGNGRHDDIAGVVFDYISRLSEFYYFKRV